MTCYLIQILKSMKNNFSSKHKRRRRRRGQSSKKTNDEDDNRVKHEQRQRYLNKISWYAHVSFENVLLIQCSQIYSCTLVIADHSGELSLKSNQNSRKKQKKTRLIGR
ncbi:hypothetical protein DERP_013217 [Dermatophagoides pteronyssinus]|uniref:Uncharacterized protein n=1 Tax=Dermatophagoides pteronyssinus TaxID=6956 RepID=A0ABQ8IRF4_DERPT|nr:hypothetical protein DERP_013217 [Dermatophagoides pteronyssinus]